MLRFFARAFAGACCALSAAAQVLPAPPSIAARAWVVIDAQSGQELAGHAQDEEIVPASLAKLMTAYLTFAALRAERLRWDEAVVISTRAASAPAPKLFLSGAVPQNAADLLRGLLIAGANDAAIALAERVGGNEAEFVAAMNREAHRLGLSHTRYVNPSGLPQTGQVSSVGDAARLAMALTRDFGPEYAMFKERQFSFAGLNHYNRNRLLWSDPYVDGLLAGFVEDSGYYLAASAKRGERRVIAIVSGSPADAGSLGQQLLNFGLRAYETALAYRRGQSIANLQVWQGSNSSLNAGFDRDIYLTAPRGHYGKLRAQLATVQPLRAPVAQGQNIGKLSIRLGDKSVVELPVLALEPVAAAGPFGRLWDAIRLWLK